MADATQKKKRGPRKPVTDRLGKLSDDSLDKLLTESRGVVAACMTEIGRRRARWEKLDPTFPPAPVQA